MKTCKNIICIGALLLMFGGMGLDGTESKVAYIIAFIGLVLMGIGIKKMKPFLLLMICSIFMMFPEMEVNAQSSEPILSDEVIKYCDEIGKEYSICSELLQSIIITESSGNPKAENSGCVGLMQIFEKYHTDRMKRLGVTDLYDPYSNILVGADYIEELHVKYGDIGLVLDIYNGNSKAFDNNEKGIISSYAEGILERSEILERERGK